jgi:uncharacterized alkaline shock family protein YloU
MAMTDSEPGGIGGSGYSLEDLSDYLDRGRTPPIAAIDANPECDAMLATLERVGSLSRELVVHDAESTPTIDEGWLAGLVATIGRELRAGRDIPLATSDPETTLSITEGAVRELVRAAGDSVDGVLVASSGIDGDLTDAAASVTVHITISVVLAAPVLELAQHVRERVHSELLRHTQLNVTSIDVTVVDVHELTTPIESDDQ